MIHVLVLLGIVLALNTVEYLTCFSAAFFLAKHQLIGSYQKPELSSTQKIVWMLLFLINYKKNKKIKK